MISLLCVMQLAELFQGAHVRCTNLASKPRYYWFNIVDLGKG